MSKNSFQIMSTAYHMRKNPEAIANMMQSEFAKGNISYPRSWREVRILNEQRTNRLVKTVIKSSLVGEFKKTTDFFILSDKLLLSTPASIVDDFKKVSKSVKSERELESVDKRQLINRIEKYTRTLYSIENVREKDTPVKIKNLDTENLTRISF